MKSTEIMKNSLKSWNECNSLEILFHLVIHIVYLSNGQIQALEDSLDQFIFIECSMSLKIDLDLIFLFEGSKERGFIWWVEFVVQ